MANKGVPKEILKKIKATTHVGDPAKNPQLNPKVESPGVKTRNMSNDALDMGAHGSEYLVRGDD